MKKIGILSSFLSWFLMNFFLLYNACLKTCATSTSAVFSSTCPRSRTLAFPGFIWLNMFPILVLKSLSYFIIKSVILFITASMSFLVPLFRSSSLYLLSRMSYMISRKSFVSTFPSLIFSFAFVNAFLKYLS